jgi:hypothetical protein
MAGRGRGKGKGCGLRAADCASSLSHTIGDGSDQIRHSAAITHTQQQRTSRSVREHSEVETTSENDEVRLSGWEQCH